MASGCLPLLCARWNRLDDLFPLSHSNPGTLFLADPADPLVVNAHRCLFLKPMTPPDQTIFRQESLDRLSSPCKIVNKAALSYESAALLFTA
jgi:hypothetical protein